MLGYTRRCLLDDYQGGLIVPTLCVGTLQDAPASRQETAER
jgi:hypothetical protein